MAKSGKRLRGAQSSARNRDLNTNFGMRQSSVPHFTQDDHDNTFWPLLPAVAILVAAWTLMVWPWLSGTVTIPWDAKAHFQPQIQFLAQSLSRGEAPFWNPYVFSGHPQVADPQAMLLSPPFVLLAFMNGDPSAWAIDMTTLGTALLGGLALLIWCRDRGWHVAGALVASIVFVFGASMAWRMQHTGQVLSLAYWPMAMLAIDRAFARQSFAYAIAAGVIGAAIILGRDQVALLVLYLLAAYTLCLWLGALPPRRPFLATLPHALLGGATAVVVAALPILMTILLAEVSNRPSIDLEGAGRGSLHPALLITAVVPHLFGAAGDMGDFWGPPSFVWEGTGLFIAQNMGQIYVGALALLLLVIGTAKGWLWAKPAQFFFIALLVVIHYALGWYTPVFRFMYELFPGVSLYRRPADATFLIGALAAVLAGYSVHRLFERAWEGVGKWAVIVCAIALSIACLLALLFAMRFERLDRISMPLTQALLSFALAAFALWYGLSRSILQPQLAASVFAAALAIDLAYNNGPSSSSALPPAHYEVLEPSSSNDVIAVLKARQVRDEVRRDRIELAGLGFHWPNASLTHRLENTLGYNPVRLGAYSRATGAEDHVGLPEQRKFSKLFPSYRSMLADMLGLRFIAAGAPLETIDRSLTAGDFPLVYQSAKVWIYENVRALPRVMFVTEARVADFSEIEATGRWPEFDPTRTVLLEQLPAAVAPLPAPGAASSVSASIRRYANNEVTIETDSDTPGYLVLNDIHHSWWRVYLDGHAVPLLKANVLFRAVAVPAGRHSVRFQFQPVVGTLSALGICCLPPTAR